MILLGLWRNGARTSAFGGSHGRSRPRCQHRLGPASAVGAERLPGRQVHAGWTSGAAPAAIGPPIAAPLERCAELLGVDLGTV
jgi:hypothetical protein